MRSALTLSTVEAVAILLAVLAGARVTDWSRYKTNLTYSTGSVDLTDRSESGEVTPYLGLVVELMHLPDLWLRN